jgi:molecular chaperone GrpE (heat shock protein)
VANASGEPIKEEETEVPGANISTHGPQFEKGLKKSKASEDETVIAEREEAGEKMHASFEEFPAATTTKIPAAKALSTASFIALLLAVVRVRLIIEGLFVLETCDTTQ